MLLMIDNYDSFTYNLVHYLGELGEEVQVVRNDRLGIGDIESMQPDYIVLSPGPCTPAEAGICLDVVHRFAGEIPILGICLGHQVIGQAFGGRVVLAEQLMHGKTSPIRHDARSIFRSIPSPFTANRYHSLVVDPDQLPDCLEVSATTSDGVVMGLRHRRLSVEGVQFHPESILTEYGRDLLGNFISVYRREQS
ncbi:MAG: aminodeoxychorismate/anthranilate synthase component II [Eubacteriales bacterium]|nr:aminodeoxychorismate/anthranilate synthase component II [Bacillota bacterium]MBV1727829.1 aminodeoxychorismate/anthranilate synthase component II [Desulforudis sp.]MDP3050540.1 aminodeoxychorismate/anthranilate synthase component II [Eubacteriales bacterium]MDQ7788427.1 aminodeoxychorismate/anthranilate synthase component II [Clostridia bacterium]MBU4532438.1 aminodeoxychorismate/anthranilate synthase component II [Bacillota bacterium]